MPRIRITSADAYRYANKKGITIKEACKVFDKHYTPTINGWFKDEEKS